MEAKITFSSDKALIKIEGAITSDNAYIFGDKLSQVLESDVDLLELDFSACRNISSSGIGKLLNFYRKFIDREGRIEVIKSSKSVYEIFTIIKLNQLFTVNLWWIMNILF